MKVIVQQWSGMQCEREASSSGYVAISAEAG